MNDTSFSKAVVAALLAHGLEEDTHANATKYRSFKSPYKYKTDRYHVSARSVRHGDTIASSYPLSKRGIALLKAEGDLLLKAGKK